MSAETRALMGSYWFGFRSGKTFQTEAQFRKFLRQVEESERRARHESRVRAEYGYGDW